MALLGGEEATCTSDGTGPASDTTSPSTLLGTGLRFGELAGLRRRRVHLGRAMPVLEVGTTRYEAGRFGNAFKPCLPFYVLLFGQRESRGAERPAGRQSKV